MTERVDVGGRRRPGLVAFGLVLGLLAFVWGLADVASAQEPPGLLHQRVSMYILDVSEFDVGEGTFRADFYLSFECDRGCDPHFDFRNGSVVSSQVRRDEERRKEYRVRVELQQPRVDLRKFPFTRGRLPLELEDDFLDETQMVFEVGDGSGLDENVHLPGFHVERDLRAAMHRNRTPLFDVSYSSVEFSIGYRSHRSSVAVKDLLPLLLLTLAGLSAFMIDAEDTADRVLVAISSLLALAFFGSSLTNRVPHTDYLTLADQYVISALAVLTASLAALIVIYDGRRRWPPTKVAKMNTRIARTIVVGWAALQVAFVTSVL